MTFGQVPAAEAAPKYAASVRSSRRVPPLLCCFSHLRWDFVFQRPQHLLSRAARSFRVLYVEEALFADVRAPRLARRATREGVEILTPEVPVGFSEPEIARVVEALVRKAVMEANGAPSVGWFYTPMALAFARDLPFDLTVYDCMDELAAFKDAPAGLKAREQLLLERADVVFTGGRALFEAKCRLHENVHLFPSSIDVQHFSGARLGRVTEPDDLAPIAHPRIGYFGVLDERLDLALVDEVARLRRHWQFVMIGPVAKIDAACLPRWPNIHWLGHKSYREIPEYLGHLDLGFMPFALNAATRFISPTKTPEFLAAGLRVVSTPVRDVVRSYGAPGLVAIAESAGEMVAQIEGALAEAPSAAWRAAVDHRLGETSWDATWGGMLDHLRALADAKRKPRARRLDEGSSLVKPCTIG